MHKIESREIKNRKYLSKTIQTKTCSKQCTQGKFQGTMTKWPVQKQTHRHYSERNPQLDLCKANMLVRWHYCLTYVWTFRVCRHPLCYGHTWNCHRTISTVCTSLANLVIARAPDDFKEFSLAWSCGPRPASVYDNTGRCPSGVVRDQPDTVRWNKLSRAIMYTLISKLAIIRPKKQVVQKKKTEADLLIMIEVNTTLAQDDKNFNSTCWLHVILQIMG